MTVAADIRAFVASARKELRIMRRYPTLLLSVLFWPILLPASAVLMVAFKHLRHHYLRSSFYNA